MVRYCGLKWRSRANSCHSPMFQATNIRMPASAASGTCTASGAASSTTASSVSACTMPAMGEAAPARTLVMVRAMVPVAGMPPKKGTTKLATPCAISSWLGSWRGNSVALSATRAHSSDSMAPSIAIVSVGISSCLAVVQLSSGSAKAGSDCGMPPKREPMVSTGRLNSAVASGGQHQRDDGARQVRAQPAQLAPQPGRCCGMV